MAAAVVIMMLERHQGGFKGLLWGRAGWHAQGSPGVSGKDTGCSFVSLNSWWVVQGHLALVYT